MKTFGLLCCFLSFVYATTFEIVQKGGEITGTVTREKLTLSLTREQMNKCQVLKEALREANVSDDSCTIAGFESFSLESLSLLFQAPGIDWRCWNTTKIISFIKLLDFCGNKKDLKIWLTYLRKRCKSNGVSMSKVIKHLKRRGLHYLVGLFLGGFSMFEVDVLGINRVDFASAFLPTIKWLSIRPDVIEWIRLHPHVSVEKLCNLEALILDGWIHSREQETLLNFLGPLTTLKTLQFDGDSVQYPIVWHVIKQNTNLESVFLCFTNGINILTMEGIFRAISSLTRLRELTIQVNDSIPSGFFQLAMGNFRFDSLVKLSIFLGNSQMRWGNFFEKFQKLEELTIYSTKFNFTELIGLFNDLSTNRLATLSKFIFSGNWFVEIQNSAAIGDAFLGFLKSNPFLTVLNMSGNNLCELGQIFLSKLSKKNPSIIRELLFGWNGIPLVDESDFDLKYFERLEVLDLWGNNLTDSYFTNLLKSEHIFQKLKILRLTSNHHLEPGTSLAKFIGLCPNLEELILPKCGLGPTFIDVLNTQHKIPQKLKVLDLSFNTIVDSEKSFNSLMTLLSRFENLEALFLASTIDTVNPTIRTLSTSCSQFVLEKLESLNIDSNAFDVDALQFILRMIPTSKDFVMNMENISELGAGVLTKFIEGGGLMNLTYLSLDFVNYEDEDKILHSLLKGLRHLPRLTDLILRTSSEAGGELVANFCKNMPFLK